MNPPLLGLAGLTEATSKDGNDPAIACADWARSCWDTMSPETRDQAAAETQTSPSNAILRNFTLLTAHSIKVRTILFRSRHPDPGRRKPALFPKPEKNTSIGRSRAAFGLVVPASLWLPGRFARSLAVLIRACAASVEI